MIKAKLVLLGYIACIATVFGVVTEEKPESEEVIRPVVNDDYNLSAKKADPDPAAK